MVLTSTLLQAVLGTLGLLQRPVGGGESNAAGATDVLVHGCSSGGVAVFANADHVRQLLPRRARVAAAANSGYINMRAGLPHEPIPCHRLSVEWTGHEIGCQMGCAAPCENVRPPHRVVQ